MSRAQLALILVLGLVSRSGFAASSVGTQDPISYRSAPTKTGEGTRRAPSSDEKDPKKIATHIEELKRKLTGDKPEITTRVELAELLSEQEAYSDVVIYLKSYSDQLPRHGLIMLAKAHHQQKDFLSEIRTLTYMTSQSESDYVGETMLGEAYSGTKNTLEATKHFRAAIKINPRYKPAYTGLLKEFEIRKNKGEARQLLEEMVLQFPNDNEFLTQLCTSYTQESFIEKAISICTIAIERDADKADNHVNLSIAYKLDKNDEQSIKIINQAAKKFPKSALAQCAAGDAALRVHNAVGAVKYYKLGVELDPKKADCQLGLGNAAFEAEQFELALKGYVSACKLDRGLTLALKKATAILRQKKQEDWQRTYAQAIGQCVET